MLARGKPNEVSEVTLEDVHADGTGHTCTSSPRVLLTSEFNKSVPENSEIKEHWVWAGEVAQQAEALVTKPDKLPYPGSTK